MTSDTRQAVAVTRVDRDKPFMAVVLSPFTGVVQHMGETWQQFIGVDAARHTRETTNNLNRAYELGRRSPHREGVGA